MTENKSLLEASRGAVEAILAGDLALAARFLAARERAIAQGAAVTEEIVGLGERACALLAATKSSLAKEIELVERLHRAFAQPRLPRIDVTL